MTARRPRFLPLSLVLLLLAACTAGEAPGGRSLLLLTLDTTRRDALSCYGEGGTSTPALDRLAAEGVLFERAYTSAPLTLPAHTSILTGLYPLRHGVRNNGIGALSPDTETLAERARAAGYRTAAFVGSVVLDPAFGLDQGFETYDAPAPSGDGREAERPAREVVDAALEWNSRRDRGRPFFLWLHFYDPHTPYDPPGGRTGDLHRDYLSEVRAMDGEIGRLLDALRDDGTLTSTIVVAVGDHGEAFGEHGENGHSVFCYDTTLRVPLIVRWPDGRRAGDHADELVSVVDLLPTLCASLRLDPPRDVDGIAFGDPRFESPDRGLYFESYYGFFGFGWSPIAGWLDGRGKYLHSADPELYDLARDPGETRNLVRERADDVARYRDAIDRLAARPALVVDTSGVDAALAGELAKLGYAGAGASDARLPHPLAPSDLPSPASMRELYDESIDALQLAQQGHVDEAAEVFERVLASNPRNPFALEQLASCQVHQERVEDAVATLRRLIDVVPQAPPGAWFKLGVCLRSLGRTDEAIDALEHAVALGPDRPQFLRELMSAYQDAGRAPEVARTAEMLRRAEARR